MLEDYDLMFQPWRCYAVVQIRCVRNGKGWVDDVESCMIVDDFACLFDVLAESKAKMGSSDVGSGWSVSPD